MGAGGGALRVQWGGGGVNGDTGVNGGVLREGGLGVSGGEWGSAVSGRGWGEWGGCVECEATWE